MTSQELRARLDDYLVTAEASPVDDIADEAIIALALAEGRLRNCLKREKERNAERERLANLARLEQRKGPL